MSDKNASHANEEAYPVPQHKDLHDDDVMMLTRYLGVSVDQTQDFVSANGGSTEPKIRNLTGPR